MRLAARVLVLIVVVVGCNTTSRAREQLSTRSVTRKVTHALTPDGRAAVLATCEQQKESSRPLQDHRYRYLVSYLPKKPLGKTSSERCDLIDSLKGRKECRSTQLLPYASA
ncbi:unnamed protein product [Nippostrongylus brasiliensis]|uniref:Lipoprotein n=1 Tax=Nippostrongylus brasiliensis TaxID=27835 RepID=A0A0N4YWG5_NIPBR|nr:unnamed protein product [Nippostrongylus brasiliensis]